MVSYLDKKWMTPQLKNLNRKIKREFHKIRKSSKWKKLKKKFKILKRQTVQKFYSNFVNELKTSNPAKWYSMAKRLGAEESSKSGDLSVNFSKHTQQWVTGDAIGGESSSGFGLRSGRFRLLLRGGWY